MQATYSPHDNKIRIYPSARLDPETYARVKAAGFVWAPKQEIFVTPMWTPEREDLARELCGEIDDEDITPEERAAERAERFEGYAEKREAEAGRAQKAVKAIADGIPFGQPILVGHHSEKRARKDAERIENGMRKAVNLWETSKYWERRAHAAIRHAKYKERPDVRTRRIKGIEADLRKQEKSNKESQLFIDLWSRMEDPKLLTRKDSDEVTTLDRARWIAGRDQVSGIGKAPDHPWGLSLADTLRPDGTRYAGCPAYTPERAREIAIKTHTRSMAYRNRWIAHYQNRLAYERAMLAASGGIVADRTGPEKGGACKCWASHRGCFSYIQKVNKVSVTVIDNWGNGGGNFTRNIPFDKLTAVMTAAEVQAAREAGTLKETEDKTGFFLTNSKPPEPQPTREQEKIPDGIQVMKDSLAAGVAVVSAANLFPTPPVLARRMVALAIIQPEMRILEPSAGTGNLIREAFAAGPCNITGIEINLNLAELLRGQWKRLDNDTREIPRVQIHTADFLSVEPEPVYDRVLMNPPFDHGSDIAHIQHARKFLKPGGKLVGICADGPKHAEILKPLAGFWEELPQGTFEGTHARAVLFVIDSQKNSQPLAGRI